METHLSVFAELLKHLIDAPSARVRFAARKMMINALAIIGGSPPVKI